MTPVIALEFKSIAFNGTIIPHMPFAIICYPRGTEADRLPRIGDREAEDALLADVARLDAACNGHTPGLRQLARAGPFRWEGLDKRRLAVRLVVRARQIPRQ